MFQVIFLLRYIANGKFLDTPSILLQKKTILKFCVLFIMIKGEMKNSLFIESGVVLPQLFDHSDDVPSVEHRTIHLMFYSTWMELLMLYKQSSVQFWMFNVPLSWRGSWLIKMPHLLRFSGLIVPPVSGPTLEM